MTFSSRANTLRAQQLLEAFQRADFHVRNRPFSELQSKIRHQHFQYLIELILYFSQRKHRLAGIQDEQSANLALSLMLITEATCLELAMFQQLDEQDPHKAWDWLISAQFLLEDAFDAYPDICTLVPGIVSQLGTLRAYEGLLFPPQQFLSPGIVVDHLLCSICRDRADACVHFERVAYKGQLCKHLGSKKWEANHLAMVDDPDDKRTRVIAFKEPKAGHWLDWMSGRPASMSRYGEIDDAANTIVQICFERIQIMPPVDNWYRTYEMPFQPRERLWQVGGHEAQVQRMVRIRLGTPAPHQDGLFESKRFNPMILGRILRLIPV